MITNGVELKKVLYNDKNRISTISQQIANDFIDLKDKNANIAIKRNIFGQKWILKINEINDNRKKSRKKIVIYVTVFIFIVATVISAIFLTFENALKSQTINNQPSNRSILNKFELELNETTPKKLCQSCNKNQICLKIDEIEPPQCLNAIDSKDPTGCGGLCKINTQYCQILDSHQRIYQCSTLITILKCFGNSFNCGNRCISKMKRCDGRIDCTNFSDELKCNDECNRKGRFKCANSTVCLELSKKCNGIVDCWDKSDESDCPKTFSCDEASIPCLNGECVPKQAFCDGKFDCRDKSDEPRGCQISQIQR